MDYAERQKQSKVIPPNLVHALWSTIKSARDDAANQEIAAKHRKEMLDDMLRNMRAHGMQDHLPSIDEVREAWNRK